LEFYPNVGEILAVSVFYKKIYDAIEQQVVWSSNPGKRFVNTPQAENYGLELEFRKTLDFLDDWMGRFSITGNYSRIISKVQFSEVRIVGLTPDFVPIKETFTDIRSMQGQASYTMNGGLHFTDPEWGTSVSVMYNRFGVRVDAVADIRDEDIFELPRGTVDVSLTQQVTPSLEVKVSGRDIGASVRRYEFRTGQVFKNVIVGATYGLQLSYSF
jgi:outer membrane receptor protein involved in Fe transport